MAYLDGLPSHTKSVSAIAFSPTMARDTAGNEQDSQHIHQARSGQAAGLSVGDGGRMLMDRCLDETILAGQLALRPLLTGECRLSLPPPFQRPRIESWLST